ASVDEQILEQVEGRGIGPLQIVEEQDQGLLGPRENPDELAKGELEASLDLAGVGLVPRGPRAEDRDELGDEVSEQLLVRAERGGQLHTPRGESLFRFGEQLSCELAKG